MNYSQKKTVAKRPLPYLDTFLANLPNEEWKDIVNYDGIYSISNFGRVKSEQRYDNLGRLIKSRILKQTVCKAGDPTVKLSVNNNKRTHRICNLVGFAYKGEKKDGEVYCHRNKIKTDNSTGNIIKIPHSESCLIDYKIGVKVDWGFSEIRKTELRNFNDKFHVFQNGVLHSKICVACMIELPIEQFYYRAETGSYKRKCVGCTLKSQGVKDVGKLKDRLDLAGAGMRCCSVCKVMKKLDSEFSNSKSRYLGKSNNCKECSKALHAAFIKKQREEVGDFYVKQYALRRYNIKIKTVDEFKKYRLEINDSRKRTE
jgi:hypothetical protein